MAFLDFHLVSPISTITLFHTFLLIYATSTLSKVDFSPPWDLEKAKVMYPCCFPPIMVTPSTLMLGLSIMIKAEGQSSILSKCYITSKYYNRR